MLKRNENSIIMVLAGCVIVIIMCICASIFGLVGVFLLRSILNNFSV